MFRVLPSAILSLSFGPGPSLTLLANVEDFGESSGWAGVNNCVSAVVVIVVIVASCVVSVNSCDEFVSRVGSCLFVGSCVSGKGVCVRSCVEVSSCTCDCGSGCCFVESVTLVLGCTRPSLPSPAKLSPPELFVGSPSDRLKMRFATGYDPVVVKPGEKSHDPVGKPAEKIMQSARPRISVNTGHLLKIENHNTRTTTTR